MFKRLKRRAKADPVQPCEDPRVVQLRPRIGLTARFVRQKAQRRTRPEQTGQPASSYPAIQPIVRVI